MTEGYKVDLEDDAQLEKAIESLPQARALYENARKIIAQRGVNTGAQATVKHPFNRQFFNFQAKSVWNPCPGPAKISKFRGRLAQLGERIVRNDEAGGSIPPPSTKSFNRL